MLERENGLPRGDTLLEGITKRTYERINSETYKQVSHPLKSLKPFLFLPLDHILHQAVHCMLVL